MSVLLIAKPTLMPDSKLTVMKTVKPNEDKITVSNILKDLSEEIETFNGDGENEQKMYCSSFIVELDIEHLPGDFNFNLLITPDIDIVSYYKF